MEIINFESSAEFRSWLEENHTSTKGIWLRIYKKGAKTPSITYAEALDQALCYGWIDSQKKPMMKTPGFKNLALELLKVLGQKSTRNMRNA